jgi:hypothetical protein
MILEPSSLQRGINVARIRSAGWRDHGQVNSGPWGTAGKARGTGGWLGFGKSIRLRAPSSAAGKS